MALIDLSDSELGAIVRASPLWEILISQEEMQKNEKASKLKSRE
jgi:hypothetical protein